ncbi:GNAT family N-acetyltransferase, partial [uncultured Maritalea sp.]|uniref:GNAT family N-acetyltransferase n=1 Tax=uncultured Maritalea sp. TaxID=757249 RepID=UPI002613071D
MVERLRKAGAIAGEMVLPAGGALAGYYALSYMVAPKGWLCLAPVAVAPDWQARGLGKRMMGQLAAWAEATRAEIVVLGRADLYESVGFSRAKAARFETPY